MPYYNKPAIRFINMNPYKTKLLSNMGICFLVNIILTIAVIVTAINIATAERDKTSASQQAVQMLEYYKASTPEKAITALNQILSSRHNASLNGRNERQRDYERDVVLIRLNFLYHLTGQRDKMISPGEDKDDLVRMIAGFDYLDGILWGKLALANDMSQKEINSLIQLAGKDENEN